MSPKVWLSFEDQASLLVHRGLNAPNHEELAEFLSKTNYYRLSGYFRYWQRDPLRGDDRFLEGTSFELIKRLYLDAQTLAAACDEALHPVEVMLRTRFAYSYANKVGPTGSYTTGKGLTRSPNVKSRPVEAYALDDLDRSKEPFVAHFRKEVEDAAGNSHITYDEMPVWAAAEVFSFGTLSRMIEASAKSGVLGEVAESIGTSPATLPSQVRSIVYLRNRVAHCSKIWNHSVLDAPAINRNIATRAKKRHRPFSDHSIYRIFVALDHLGSQSGVTEGWLTRKIDPLLDANPLLAAGIATPRKYGEMSPSLLLGQSE